MIMSKPRFTAPAAKAALAQCMTALIPFLCATSRMLSQVAMWSGTVLSARGASPSANERSEDDDEPVEHRDARKCDESDGCGYGERNSASEQGENAAGQRERHAGKDE